MPQKAVLSGKSKEIYYDIFYNRRIFKVFVFYPCQFLRMLRQFPASSGW